MTPTVRVQAEDFDAAAEAALLPQGRTDIGAVVTFTGLCRDEGGRLAALELEHYPGMAEEEIARVAAKACERWPLQGVTAIHRFGKIAPGAQIVLVVTASSHRVAAFVVLDVIDNRLDRFSAQAGVDDPLRQDGGALVAPAELEEETIPDVAVLVAARGAVRVGPGENLFVIGAGEGAFAEVGVAHAKEATATAVEREELLVAEIGHVVRRQLARGVQPDLVEHPAEIDEPANLRIDTPQTGNVGHVWDHPPRRHVTARGISLAGIPAPTQADRIRHE